MVSLAVVAVGIYVYQGSRERALEQIQESQQDLQNYLDHMTTFSAKIGLDGRVAFANKIAKEVSGLGEHMIGTKFIEGAWWTFDEEVHKRVEAAFYQVLTGKTVTYDERMRIATINGPMVLTVNFSMIPISENNQLKYVLAEARDISAEQAVDQAKSEFVALASQQLYTPIKTIVDDSQHLLVGDVGRLTEAERTLVRQIYLNSQRMNTLVRDMLLVSELELGKLLVRPAETSITAIASEVVQESKTTLLTGRTLDINEDYANDLPPVAVDPRRIRPRSERPAGAHRPSRLRPRRCLL